MVSGVLEPVLVVFEGGCGAGYGCWRLVLDAFGSTGGSRRWGMGDGWFMGVPGYVLAAGSGRVWFDGWVPTVGVGLPGWDWPGGGGGGGLVRLVGWCRGWLVRDGPRRCCWGSWDGGRCCCCGAWGADPFEHYARTEGIRVDAIA